MVTPRYLEIKGILIREFLRKTTTVVFRVKKLIGIKFFQL